MKTKEIAYAYPTSPRAENHGYGRIGCYIVEVTENGKAGGVIVGAFPNIESAREVADALPIDYNKYSRER